MTAAKTISDMRNPKLNRELCDFEGLAAAGDLRSLTLGVVRFLLRRAVSLFDGALLHATRQGQ